MKFIMSIVLLLGLTSQAFAYTMQEIEGKYKVSSKVLRMENILTLDKSGRLKLTNQQSKLSCSGKSKLGSKNIITADLKCKNFFQNRTFDFTIDLSKVEDLNNFTAPLIFPMIGEIIWTFERLEN